jgi:hypothetical protein
MPANSERDASTTPTSIARRNGAPWKVSLAVVLVPDVGVRVQQHDGYWPMDRGLCAQLAEHDRVVATQHQRHDPSAGERAQAGVELLGGPLWFPGVTARSPPSLVCR